MHDGERAGGVEVVVHRRGERRRQRRPARPAPTRSTARCTKPSIRRYADGGLPQRLVRVVDPRAVVRRQRGSSAARPAGRRAPTTWSQVDHVAQRLAHLGLAEVEQRVVHPVAGERQPGRAGLGDLVLVVREGQVEPAAVDVELGAQVAPGTSPSTRCASRAGPGPTATASARRPARRAWRPSTARSRAGRAWPARGRRAAACMSSGRWPDSARSRRTTSRRSRRRRSRRRPAYACPASISVRDQLVHLGDVPGGPRLVGRRQHVERPVGRGEDAARWRTRSTRTAGPARCALASTLSSMSVMLRTNVTS